MHLGLAGAAVLVVGAAVGSAPARERQAPDPGPQKTRDTPAISRIIPST